MEFILNVVADYIAHYWVVSLYLSVMAFNESAIVASFLFFSGSGAEKYFLVAIISAAGSLTNDVILYWLARRGLSNVKEYTDKESTMIFKKIFLENELRSLLFIKFFFGIRLALTMYLVAKKKIPFWRYIGYDLLGIALYVFVLSLIAWLMKSGLSAIAPEAYSLVTKSVTVFLVVLISAHIGSVLLKRFFQQYRKNAIMDKL